MRKILLIFILLIQPLSVFGATVCARNGTYISILRKDVNGTSGECTNSINTQDPTDKTKTWKIVYDYKTITGYAACNTISGTYARAKTNLYTTPSDEGTHCWCKMEPVSTYGYTTGIVSYWVYLNTFEDSTACLGNTNSCNSNTNGCTAACMNAMKNDNTFRGAVFESIW